MMVAVCKRRRASRQPWDSSNSAEAEENTPRRAPPSMSSSPGGRLGWLERHPVQRRKVAGSIPGWGCIQGAGQPTDVSLPLPASLSKSSAEG